MLIFLVAALLLMSASGGVKQFRPAGKSLVPRDLIEQELCPDPDLRECWKVFEETGQVWAGDVSGDGFDELLIYPGVAFRGSGGQSFYLYEKRQDKWVSLLEEGWLIRRFRSDILPVVRQGYSDIRLEVDLCFKWDGSQYVAYSPSDYRQLPAELFDASDAGEAEIFWAIRYAGRKTFAFESQWFPYPPRWPIRGVNDELNDPEYGVTWLALSRGGVWGVQGNRVFLLLPQPDYLGAGKLELEGDWLLIYGPGDPPDLLARYNRRTRELRREADW